MALQTKDELFCKYFLSAWSITHKTITHHVYNISKSISLMRRFLHTRPRGHDVSMSNTNQVHPQSYSIHHETKQPYWHGNDKLTRRENLAGCIASSVDVANEPQAVDIRPQCILECYFFLPGYIPVKYCFDAPALCNTLLAAIHSMWRSYVAIKVLNQVWMERYCCF